MVMFSSESNLNSNSGLSKHHIIALFRKFGISLQHQILNKKETFRLISKKTTTHKHKKSRKQWGAS